MLGQYSIDTSYLITYSSDPVLDPHFLRSCHRYGTSPPTSAVVATGNVNLHTVEFQLTVNERAVQGRYSIDTSYLRAYSSGPVLNLHFRKSCHRYGTPPPLSAVVVRGNVNLHRIPANCSLRGMCRDGIPGIHPT